MKRLMNFLFLSCKKSSELIEKRSAFGLSFYEQIRLLIHIGMCSGCTAYQKQSLSLDNTFKQINQSCDSQLENSEPDSSEDLKRKIIKDLEKE